MRNGMIMSKWGNQWEWYRNGKLHREDGPAVVCVGGSSKWWYRHGKLHREDGPAIEHDDDGLYHWFLNGNIYTEEEYNTEMRLRKWGMSVDA